MVEVLTPLEADEVAAAILPTAQEWIAKSMFERLFLRISDIGNVIRE